MRCCCSPWSPSNREPGGSSHLSEMLFGLRWLRYPVTREGHNGPWAQTSPQVAESDPLPEPSQARSKILEATEGSGNRSFHRRECVIPTTIQLQPRTSTSCPLGLWGSGLSRVGYCLSRSVHVGSLQTRWMKSKLFSCHTWKLNGDTPCL